MNTSLSLIALVIAMLATATLQAHAERSGNGVARVPTSTSNTQSWTVYAPSGRPVTFGPRQGDGRWWPTR